MRRQSGYSAPGREPAAAQGLPGTLRNASAVMLTPFRSKEGLLSGRHVRLGDAPGCRRRPARGWLWATCWRTGGVAARDRCAGPGQEPDCLPDRGARPLAGVPGLSQAAPPSWRAGMLCLDNFSGLKHPRSPARPPSAMSGRCFCRPIPAGLTGSRARARARARRAAALRAQRHRPPRPCRARRGDRHLHSLARPGTSRTRLPMLAE